MLSHYIISTKISFSEVTTDPVLLAELEAHA
jgi:hypothetical protein